MLSIGFVAANLGVSTSTLRKWEERYGYPRPLRSEGGSRWYREADLIALRQAKRLLDRGIRARRVFADFEILLAAVKDASEVGKRRMAKTLTGPIADYIDLIHRDELATLRARLQQVLTEEGSEGFIQSTAAPLMRAVGEGWARGEIDVFQEHAASGLLGSLLGQGLSATARDDMPVLVLTTPPGEQHGLALDMVSAALTQAGAHCINLGPSLPLANLLSAVDAFDADIVGLSISSVSAGRLARRFVEELRNGLPDDVELWLGGSGAAMMPTLPDGVRAFLDVGEPSTLIRNRVRTARDADTAIGS